MIIDSIHVKNFRCVREALLDCRPLTAILGRNGAGKSTFLYALGVFYDLAAPIIKEDFFGHDSELTIEIRVTYTDLRDDEKREFAAYVAEDTLTVTKRIRMAEKGAVQQYFGTAFQIPEFAEIRGIPGKQDQKNAWNSFVDAGKLPELTTKVKRADEIPALMESYETTHPELRKPCERTEQFFGPANIGGGKLDKYTKYVLIPAVREASEEVSGRKGAASQLLDLIVLRKVNARKDVQELKADIERRVKAVYSTENLRELPELGKEISKTLQQYAPASELRLAWGEHTLPDIPLPEPVPTLVEDTFEGKIDRKGHGLQRALIMTLLQHLAMTTAKESFEVNAPVAEGVGQPAQQEISSSGPDFILGIEEPELYLHPSRCRYLSQVLSDLAKMPAAPSVSRNQVVYTTHSPHFVDLGRFDSVRVVTKTYAKDAPPCSRVAHFSVAKAAARLAEVCQADPSLFTEDSFRVRTTPIMNAIVNEGFFSEVVVVVEGASDMAVLYKLQQLMGQDWLGKGIVVVPSGGKQSIDRPTIIFRGLGIPTFFVFDGDARDLGKQKQSQTVDSNHRLLRLAGVASVDFPATQVKADWAVWHDNMEGVIKAAIGEEEFVSVRQLVATEYGFEDEPARVCKNMEGAARFVEVVYEKGLHVPELEQVVTNVSSLLPSATGT